MVNNTFECTHVGLLPRDWECVQVNEVIDEISMGPFGSDITVSNFVSSGIPVLNGYEQFQKYMDSFSPNWRVVKSTLNQQMLDYMNE